MLLFALSLAVLMATSVLLASKELVAIRWGEPARQLIDVICTVGIGAGLCMTTLNFELSWFTHTEHSLAQIKNLIERGHADAAREIYLDHVVLDVAEHRTNQVMEAVILLLIGGAVGFRVGKLRAIWRDGRAVTAKAVTVGS